MSRYRRFEFIEEPIHHYPSVFFRETSIVAPKLLSFPSFIEEDLDLGLAIDVFSPCPVPSPFEFFDTATDLVRVERTPSVTYKRIHRVERVGTELYLQSLNDRLSELESRFDRLLVSQAAKVKGDRRYAWTAEIKGPEKNGFDRKYKWVAEFKEEQEKKKEQKKAGIAKNYKWLAEIKGKGEHSGSSRTYTIKVESSGDGGNEEKEKVKKKDKKKKGNEVRIVEIEEPNQDGSLVLRQVQ